MSVIGISEIKPMHDATNPYRVLNPGINKQNRIQQTKRGIKHIKIKKKMLIVKAYIKKNTYCNYKKIKV